METFSLSGMQEILRSLGPRRGVIPGVVYGSWNDLNENGIQNTNPQDPNFHRCEDFDLNGYDEAEYFGDHSDRLNSVVWFDTENIMKSITLDLTHIVIQNRTSSDSTDWRDECTTLAGSEVLHMEIPVERGRN